jgi:molecular chaperone GrpE
MSPEPRVGSAGPESEPESAEPTAAAADGEAKALEDDLDELAAKAAERDEYLELAQRTQADFENYRKRAAKDVRAAEGRGVVKLTMELLRALDNLERAVDHLRPGEDQQDAGYALKLACDELHAALTSVGVEDYWPEGERFDPELHEAMATRPVDGAESGTVTEVHQRGYRYNGTVLRPARVVVAE